MVKLLSIWTLAHIAFTPYALAGLSSDQVPLTEIPRYGSRSGRVQSPWTYRWYQDAMNGFPDDSAAHKYFTDLVGYFMEDNNITQAQLSVARGGSQLVNYAFTWNDPNEADTYPDSVFLLASVSKIYCVAAIQSLFNSTDPTTQLSPETKVYKRLGYTSAADPRVFNITVQNLLEHQGGDDRSKSRDPAYYMREIAQNVSGGARPATERNIVDWKLKQMLDYTPGTAPADGIYSNYGYILLSYLVQNVTNSTSYYDYLSEKVLQPLNLDVRQWLTDPKYHVNDRVKQIDRGYGLSALNPLSNDLVPSIYGGDDMYKDSDMGGAALAASAATLTRTVSIYPAWGWGQGRNPGSARTGSTPGAYAWVQNRYQDDLDFAVVFNTRDFNTSSVDNYLQEQINNYLDVNKPSF